MCIRDRWKRGGGNKGGEEGSEGQNGRDGRMEEMGKKEGVGVSCGEQRALRVAPLCSNSCV
eukprot:8623608-Prorocentrum_lima.AAC.1